MNEEIIRFGKDSALVGILSQADIKENPTRLACLFPNVGLAHRIGPHRLNVRLARGLTTSGIASLRFDLTGVGDSSTLPSRDSYLEQAVTDMRAAMDYLESAHGIQRFLVFGICSGAANAYRLALADTRVAGILMMDGFAYPTQLNRVADMLLRIWLTPTRKVPSFLMQRLLNISRKFRANVTNALDASIEVIAPDQSEFERDVNLLIQRGVSLYFVFSGSMQVTSGDRDQLGGIKNSQLLQNIRCEFWDDVDHTATSLRSQQRLLKSLQEWALKVGNTPKITT